MSVPKPKSSPYGHLRKADPYMDRRSGEDRRQTYSLTYFMAGNPDRRIARERRIHLERRTDCIPINKWASVCPDMNELANNTIYIIDLRRKEC